MKKYRFENGFTGTYLEAIDSGMFIKSDIRTVPKYQYNRIKYNRMDNREQREYEEKLKENKTEYRVYVDNDSFFTVPKRDFLYFQDWLENQDTKNNPDEYASDEELAHLFGYSS